MPQAPVCFIEPQVDIGVPLQPRMPTVPNFSSDDPASMARALSALKQGYELLAGQRAPGSALNSKTQPKAKQGRFTETHRTKDKVRVFNKDDHDQFVDVERITSLTLRDNVTGETWIWKR